MVLRLRYFTLLCTVAVLAACGHDRDHKDPPPSTPAPPVAGTLIENPPQRASSFSDSTLLTAINLSPAGTQILKLIVAPKCGVDVHRIRYNTVDPAGQATTASGALMIPTGAAAACQGARPIVAYAHGTVPEKSYNIADLNNPDNVEGLLIAATFAAQGYIVVAPNYAGYDTSTLTFHPYLHGEQQSRDVANALSAARSALPTSSAPTVTDSGRLFITGYSQGGYVAMATHRLLQANGQTVTASAPMSGPYALSAFGDAVFQGQVIKSAPLLATWLMTSYQKIYNNIYSNPADVFDARYASGIDSLLPTAGKRSDLFQQGRLPAEQLFSSTPPDPAYAVYTPATMPANLAPVFAQGFGPQALITNAYRLGYLQDSLAHPDGGFPMQTDGRPPSAPAQPLRVAFKANDLRNWSPTAPVLLCAGHDDPTVLYLNTDLMQRYWTAAGVTSSLRVLDVDEDPALNDPDVVLKTAFDTLKEAVAQSAVAGGATDGGAAAVADAYHGSLVPPFCLAAVKSFFDSK